MVGSDDDGETWKTRDLPAISTVGYVTATQARNGLIEIVTSKTGPELQIEMPMVERADRDADGRAIVFAVDGGKPRHRSDHDGTGLRSSFLPSSSCI